MYVELVGLLELNHVRHDCRNRLYFRRFLILIADLPMAVQLFFAFFGATKHTDSFATTEGGLEAETNESHAPSFISVNGSYSMLLGMFIISDKAIISTF